MTTALSFFPLTLASDQATVEPATIPPLVAVYGDSMSDAGQLPWLSSGVAWPERMGRALGADTANMAVGGSGYYQCPHWSTFPHEVVVHPVPAADVVVVFGGYNDRAHPPNAVAVAATTTFTAVRLTMPGAALVVIGPQWPGANPPEELKRLRDEVRAAARAAGAAWVDPLAEGWFAGRPELIWADNIHPNDLGQQYLAELIAPHVAAALGR